MTIAKYTPISEVSSYSPITEEYRVLPVALFDRLASNGQYNLRERLRKTNMFWPGATTTNISGSDNSEGDELVGYYNTGLTYTSGNVPIPGHDPQTYGLQFSTHIAEPYLLTIPVATLTEDLRDSAGFGNNYYFFESFKVRMCAKIDHADAQVLAWVQRGDKGRTNSGKVSFADINNPAKLIDFSAGVFDLARFKGNGYDSTLPVAGNGAVLLDMPRTSVSGTDGCSYFEFEIPSIATWYPEVLNDPINYNTKDFSQAAEEIMASEPVLVLAFLSKLGALMDTVRIRSFIDGDIQNPGTLGSGAYLELNSTFAAQSSKFSPDVPPGKFHAMAKVNYQTGSGVSIPDGLGHTYHHVLQMLAFPSSPTAPLVNYLFNPDLIENPWNGTDTAGIVLYPSIPFMPTTTNPTLIANQTTGSIVELYYVSTITLFSVTVEPSLEDIP